MRIGKKTHPFYFTNVYMGGELKKSSFDAWYRGIKAFAFLRRNIGGIIKKNDQFFKENPDYVEGALCGKLKENK